MSRKQKPAPGHRLAVAAGGAERNAAKLLAEAVAHHNARAFAAAERDYGRFLALVPGHAAAHSRMGAVLMAQGKIGAAIGHLERALSLDPTLFEACGNLAQAYMAAGRMEPAVHMLARALEFRETPQGRALFVEWVRTIQFRGEVDARIRRFVMRALVEGWAKPRELTRTCISLIKCGSAIGDFVRRAEAAWPALLPTADLFAASGTAPAFADGLFCRLLECDPIMDIGLERLLTGVRAAMLQRACGEDTPLDERALEFCGALARQCFINEYLYPVLESEAAQVAALQSALSEKLAAGQAIPPLWPLAVGAYGPLFALDGAERLGARAWPPSVAAVIGQQVEEPLEERRLAADIPALTGIDDAVSRAVRQQYEENPYPRWSAPHASARASAGASAAIAPHDILIAGCGTGRTATLLARQNPRSHILAVDLSLASLGYAARMAKSLQLGNIAFAQADIARLDSIGRTFDFIDCSGVLHHMADPWRGWRMLLALLKPGGTMQVGLYSGLGRRDIVAARALIAEHGYRAIAPDIRRCRQDIAAATDPLLRAVTERFDFFTMSECRDLLFHVQEHRITLPEIKSFIAANDLQFAGFLIDPDTGRWFARRFPEASAPTDLDRWHSFETEAANTFAGMYQFQVRKPPAHAVASAAAN